MSTTSCPTANEPRCVRISGVPNPKQAEFFASRARYIAYGGARGGGKSWALRRKLVALCLRYPGINCLLVRRSVSELKANHLVPFLKEYGDFMTYSEAERRITVAGVSTITLGYCSSKRDTLRYQGQEFDIIAIDEATQLSEYQYSVFKACLRGVNEFPKRIYLTCNPGGIGHAWVKRLFVDRDFRAGERAEDHHFIPAVVYDNKALLSTCPDYAVQLESLSPTLRDAWLYGKWNVFEGQFLPEFDPERHIREHISIPKYSRHFIAFDYGFDRLAALLFSSDGERLTVESEYCASELTLSEAAKKVAELSGGLAEYAVASPDLWNRRQDSGRSGFEIMQEIRGMPPMTPADDRRVPGWRMLREYLSLKDGEPRLLISNRCEELCRCLPALLCDPTRPEDASGEPHSVTHAPEALRYGVMSRQIPSAMHNEDPLKFFIPKKKSAIRRYLD